MNQYANFIENSDLDADDVLGDYNIALVVEDPAGRRMSGQSGGYGCVHPLVLGDISSRFSGEVSRAVSDLLMAYFTGAHHGGWCTDRNGDTDYGFDKRDADVVDAAMETLELTGWTVDRSRLDDSMEAWVWVRNDFNKRSGVLCWQNSD